MVEFSNIADLVAIILSLVAIVISRLGAKTETRIALWEKRYEVYLHVADMVSVGDWLWAEQQKRNGRLTLQDEVYMLYIDLLHEDITLNLSNLHTAPDVPTADNTEEYSRAIYRELQEKKDPNLANTIQAYKEIPAEDVTRAAEILSLLPRIKADVRRLTANIRQAPILFPKINKDELNDALDNWEKYITSLMVLSQAYTESTLADCLNQSGQKSNPAPVMQAYKVFLDERNYSDTAVNQVTKEGDSLLEHANNRSTKRQEAIKAAQILKDNLLPQLEQDVTVWPTFHWSQKKKSNPPSDKGSATTKP